MGRAYSWGKAKRPAHTGSSQIPLTEPGLGEDELALFDLLLKDNLAKTSRERVKRASRDLLASIKTRLAELDRFWEKEQTKADVEVFILDEVFTSLPSPPMKRKHLPQASTPTCGNRL